MRVSSLLSVVLATAACTAKLEGPTPAPSTAAPALACNEQLATEIVLTGSGFAPLVESGLADSPALVLPKVTLVRASDADGAAATVFTRRVPDAPANAATGGLTWRDASTLAFSVNPALALEPGLYDVAVENPAGATGTAKGALLVVPRPTLTALRPPALCTEAGGEVVLEGDFFLVVAGVVPTVTVAGHTLVATAGECRTLAGATGAQACRTLTIEVPSALLSAGPADVVITNPAPAACASTDHERTVDPLTLEVVPPPTLTSASPRRICTGGGRITLGGTNFRPGSTVTIGTLPATTVDVTSGENLTATFGEGLVVGGPYDVTVAIPEGCSATLAETVSVVEGPRLFFVDPPVTWNGLALQLTAYGSGLSDSVTVHVVKGETRTEVAATWDPLRATRLKLDLPAGLEPGTWSIELSDEAGCPATLADALHVVDSVTMPAATVSPPFGLTQETTGINVFLPEGTDVFDPVPRLYLTRTVDGVSTAAPVEAVTVIDGRSLTAVVPAGLAAGAYDLVVVNPDGALGVTAALFTVTQNPPPKITGLAPGSLPNDGTHPFTVQGTDLRQTALALTCRSAGGTTTTSPPVTVTTQTATAVTGTFDTTTVQAPAACVVRATNGDEGSFVDFSALVITNPAQNLTTPDAGPSLVEARRAPGLVSLRASGAAKYLLALGGDDGTEAGAKDSVEGNSIDVFGTQGPTWSQQRARMTSKRTLAGAVAIGRFAYAVGGTNGTNALATVERAAMLEPSFTPEIDDLELQVRAADDTSGLGAGAWYYRVSAVLDGSDAFNPNGETLASERFPILLPTLDPARTFTLKVFWSAVPGAASYRVYRSPAANAPAGQERLIATVPASAPRAFEDTGVTVAADEESNRPLPVGSLGTWNAVATLATARKGAAVNVLPDRTQANRWWIYAAGGHDGTAALATIERLQVDVAANGAQTVGTWQSTGPSLSQARSHVGGFAGTSATTARIPAGKAFLWFGPGRNTAGSQVNVMEAMEMQADGSLGAAQAVDAPAGTSGYAPILAGNFLYLFGGGSTTDTSAKQGEICTAGVGGCQGNGPPRIRNWNQATSTSAARQFAGNLLEGATIYLVGGNGSGGTGATATTEQLIW